MEAPSNGPLLIGQVGASANTGEALLYDPTNPNNLPQAGGFNFGDQLAIGDLGNNGTPVIVRAVAPPAGLTAGTVELISESGTFLDPTPFGLGSLFPFVYAPDAGDIIAVGDINNDGFDDIVRGRPAVAGSLSDILVVTSNNAPQIDENATSLLQLPAGGAMVVCDLDADGFDDILTAPGFRWYSGKTGKVTDFVPNPPQFVAGFDKLACADLNNDHFSDVILAHPSDPNNTGSSAEFQVISLPTAPNQVTGYFSDVNPPQLAVGDVIAAGDLDKDGFAEVVIGHQNPQSLTPGTINIFSAQGKTPPPPPPFTSYVAGDQVAIFRPHLRPTVRTGIIPYQLQTILYQVPGDKSSESYATSNSFSTTTTWTDTLNSTTGFTGGVTLSYSFGAGATVGAGQALGNGESVSSTSSNSVTFSQTSTLSPSVQQAPTSGETDTGAINPNFDEYVLLVNIPFTDTIFPGATDRNVDFGAATEISLNVQQLQSLAATPQKTGVADGFTASQLSTAFVTNSLNQNGLTLLDLIHSSDAAQLLTFDPQVNHKDITQDPRFAPANPSVLAITQPQVGDPNSLKITATNVTTNGTGSSMGTGTGFSFSGSDTLSFFGISLGVSDQQAYTFTQVTAIQNTQSHQAAIALATDNACLVGSASIYLDTILGSFITGPNTLTVTPGCVTTLKTMAFNDLTLWTVGGGSATVTTTPTGASAFDVTGTSWTTIASGPMSSTILQQMAKSSDLSKVSYALEIPSDQPNKFWTGNTQMYLSAPSANVFNAYLGQVQLTGLPQNQPLRMEFTVPAYALPALTGNFNDVSFTIVLNVNPSVGWLVNDLEIGD